MKIKTATWTPPMNSRYDTHYGTWDKPDYKGRVVVALYTKDALDWLVTQDPQGIEFYGGSSVHPVRVVGVPPKLYTMFALKFAQ